MEQGLNFSQKREVLFDNEKIEYSDIIVGKQCVYINSKYVVFKNILFNLASYVLYTQKRKGNFTNIFDIYLKEILWRANVEKDHLWKFFFDYVKQKSIINFVI